MKTLYYQIKKKSAHLLMTSTLCLFGGVAAGFLTSCDDWLDVRGENIQKEQDQYDTYKGFRDALIGCYMDMASEDIYGQRLTMTDVECLADLWYFTEDDKNLSGVAAEKYYFGAHNYSEDVPRSVIKSIYAQLFKTIASANVILKNIREKGSNITDSKARAIVEGEAYAIRAYCQFDLLRLFGQLPQQATLQVKLPYSETIGIDEMPAYYDFSSYVAKLKNDITQAETLLKDNDPLFTQTFTDLNSPSGTVQDDFLYYRQARLNYWAVRALHARMALYLGETSDAHQIAIEIINAKGADGNSLIKLSGVSDLQNKYNGLPSECLFYLSKYDLVSSSVNLLIGGSTGQAREYALYITSDMLTQLYASIPGATASHNRYLNWWNRNTKNPSGTVSPALKKYWYDESDNYGAIELITKLQIIPMLRLSEQYLIAIETATSLTEAQQLYDVYMSACGYTLYDPFTTLEAARKEMTNEMRREFYGEGQMFFTYKRQAATNMLFNHADVKESDYILPLPSTEYDPNILK